MTSLAVAVIPKIVALILLVCLTRVAAGSCSSYGHSCWGGHGKRSASLRHIFNPSNHEKRSDEWYFSKLEKILKEKPIELPNVYKSHIQDSSTFDKFIRSAYLKYPFTDPAENMVTRNQDSGPEMADTGERESLENNSVDVETFFEPDEDDLNWNSKLQAYQKIGESERKGRAG